MSEQITTLLKRKMDEVVAQGAVDSEARRNALKEELQYYILNFIYHHPKYSAWIMYGGSALRIIHGLNRMSVDLDFEISHTVTVKFLQELKKDIEDHFSHTYGAGSDFLAVKIVNGRGLLLKFHVGQELMSGHTSKQLHVKIDLNHFVAAKTVIERRPINRDQLSFVIVTYNMGALMASKLGAIFLRGTRGVGKTLYQEKGRDIYDLLWYMSKKTVPDFDYLIAKGIDVKNPRILFDKLTLQMNKVSDANLEQDLEPLFLNKTYIDHWLQNWRESYFRLLEDYKINTITRLREIIIQKEISTGTYYFGYFYETENDNNVVVRYALSEYWIDFRDGELRIIPEKNLDDITDVRSLGRLSISIQNKLRQYATVFHEKTEQYFKKTNHIVLGERISTKVIRLTADNLNPNEQILLNKSALLSCELDDLLK